MNHSLTKLPQRKRAKLARIVNIIRKAVPQAEMIILFGSYARRILSTAKYYSRNTQDEFLPCVSLHAIAKACPERSRMGRSLNNYHLSIIGNHLKGDPAFFTVFPLRTQQERDRFDLLRQAYVGARYHENYKITPQELKYLARCVELLRDQTQTSCEKKMESFV